MAQPGLSTTGSSSSADRHTVESHTAVSPLFTTAMRSVSSGSSVHPRLAVVETSSSTRTARCAGWSSGTVGVIRTDSGVHAVLDAVSVTWASPWAERAGVADGDALADALADALGAGAAAGFGSSEPPGQSVTTSHTTSSSTARRRKRRRQ